MCNLIRFYKWIISSSFKPSLAVKISPTCNVTLVPDDQILKRICPLNKGIILKSLPPWIWTLSSNEITLHAIRTGFSYELKISDYLCNVCGKVVRKPFIMENHMRMTHWEFVTYIKQQQQQLIVFSLMTIVIKWYIACVYEQMDY